MTISPTTVRANGSSLRGCMAIFRGAQVLEATVTADVPTLSATSLGISVVSGSVANVQRGYRVQFFASDGTTFKGETHVRWGGTLDTTHLPVREFSQSEFLILSGDVVRVFALMAFEDKLVTGDEDAEFNPDGEPVGTHNSAPEPLACSGGYDAGFVDGYETGSPQTYRTQLTNGAPSMNLDPTSTPGNLSHLWTLVTGVAFAPGSAATDVSPTLRVNVGEYTVYHDVTDTDNGATWRQCVTYQAFDKDHLPVSVVMESAPSGDAANGWSCTFRAVNFLNLTDAPDGALVLFFVRERINGSWQSLGGTSGRSASKLLGYLSHDESDLTPQLQLQRFEVISPLARLAQLPGFSKVMFQNATPDDWAKVSTALTTLRAMIQLLRMYTFALDGGHDWLTSPYALDFPYPEVWLQKESPRQQIDELADGVDARFTCARSGLFRLDPVASLTDAATRTSLTVAYTFQRRDVARLVARRNHFDTVETLELHATSGTGTGDPDDSLPYFSRASGSPGHGADFITIERIITTVSNSQADTNARAGRRYGMRNGVYTNPVTGAKGRAPEIDVEMREVYDFLDFDDQIVRFDSFPNPRDVDLTFFDWALTRVRLDYGSGKVISTFTALTDSPPGESYFPPSSSVVVPAPPPLVFPIAPPVVIPPPSGVLPSSLIVADADHPAVALGAINSDFSGVTFEDHSVGLASGGASFCLGKPWANPYNFRQYYQITDVGLFVNNNFPSASSAWTLLASNLTLFGDASYLGFRGMCRHNLNGWILIQSDNPAQNNAVSLDGGATWLASPYPVQGSGSDLIYGGNMTVQYQPHEVHTLMAIADDDPTYFNGGSYEIYVSNDDARSWSPSGLLLPSGLYYQNYQSSEWGSFNLPYKRADGSNNLKDASQMWLVPTTPSGNSQVFRTNSRGVTYAGQSSSIAFPAPRGFATSITSFTYNGNQIAVCVFSGSDAGWVRTSEDGGDTLSAYFGEHMTTVGGMMVNGWSPNPGALIWSSSVCDVVGAHPLALTPNRGLSVIYAKPYDNVAGSEFCLFTVQ